MLAYNLVIVLNYNVLPALSSTTLTSGTTGTYLDLQCIIAGWTLTGFKYLLLKSYIQNVFDISKLAAVYIMILIKH